MLLVPLGLRRGLIAGALSLGGFAIGVVVGARVGPLVLSGGSSSPYGPLAALLGGILLGAVLAVVAEDLGGGLRSRIAPEGVPRRLDGVGGVLISTILAGAIAWVVGAAALNTPALSDLRPEFQKSAILSSINDVAPPSGPILNVLNRIQPTPRIAGPSADVSAPRGKVLKDPELQVAGESVVKIGGTACGVGISGSGWVAGDGVVVTNAHVIAGEEDTEVQLRDGTVLEATAIGYRPNDDIAVLEVDGLDLPPLPLAEEARPGTLGAVAGFPGAGEFSFSPARLGTTGTVRSQDSYGRGPVEREMTSFRGKVKSGNSGGPLIDADGAVLTTVFATSVSAKRPEGLGVPNEIVAKLIKRSKGEVETGPCA